MKVYKVEVSYTYDIEAKNEEEAEAIANDWFGDDPPRSDEINYEVKEA